MYRVFCESYANLINSLEKDSVRYNTMLPVSLLTEPQRYYSESAKCSFIYKRVSDLLFYMQKSTINYPKLKAFLWKLESRGISPKLYSVSSEEEIYEQIKGVNSILNLMYWQH